MPAVFLIRELVGLRREAVVDVVQIGWIDVAAAAQRLRRPVGQVLTRGARQSDPTRRATSWIRWASHCEHWLSERR